MYTIHYFMKREKTLDIWHGNWKQNRDQKTYDLIIYKNIFDFKL